MANVLDVAAYILQEHGETAAMKLQKLCYYAQAWHLVWEDKPLFDDEIRAWANGPVAPRLYTKHRGSFEVAKIDGGDPNPLTTEQRGTVDAVLKYYGGKSAHWLSELTHQEDPWKDARKGLKPGVRSNREISHAVMVEYYGSL